MEIVVFVSVVEDHSGAYEGPRVQVSASREEALEDLALWLEEVCMREPNPSISVEDAMDKWSEENGLSWKLEEQTLTVPKTTPNQTVVVF